MTEKPATTRSTDELGRRLQDARRDLLRTLALTDAELSTLESHQAGPRAEDAATATVGDILSRLEGQQKHELDEIEDALARLAGGTYGRCQGCGVAISPARLWAMPTARHCVECQRKLEAAPVRDRGPGRRLSTARPRESGRRLNARRGAVARLLHARGYCRADEATTVALTRAAAPVIGEPWHALDLPAVAAHLRADLDAGLTAGEVRERLARVGPNRVGDHPETPLWRLALAQFRSLVVLLLLAGALVAWVLGERVEALAILAALVLNAAIGFASEWRARISMARLRALAVPRALVRRGGMVVQVPSTELVPGDLIVLEAGVRVPADARLVRSAALRVSEAALTGESDAVDKDAEAVLDPDTPLAERRTMVYLATTALAGSGLAVVTATGLATELGRIGQLVALAGTRATPLERQVEALGRRLIGLALAVCGVVGLAGILHGQPIGLMLETAISLAVAAIPEGLPAVTTVALAAGLWRLARGGALVRRLPAVETLGSTTVICSDKTGTMTENRMTVMRLVADGRVVDLEGGSDAASGHFVERGADIAPASDPHVALLLTAAAVVNDATAVAAPDGLRLTGDPTESALLVAAAKAGLDPAAVARAWPRRREIPFDPARRMMATFNDAPGGGQAVFVKGAPSVVLDLSRRRQTAGGAIALGDADRQAVLEANRALAGEGLRVLARRVARHRLDRRGDGR